MSIQEFKTSWVSTNLKITFYYFQKYIPKFEDQIGKKVFCRSDSVDPLDVRKYIFKFLGCEFWEEFMITLEKTWPVLT